jgi:hypothetical protein
MANAQRTRELAERAQAKLESRTQPGLGASRADLTAPDDLDAVAIRVAHEAQP